MREEWLLGRQVLRRSVGSQLEAETWCTWEVGWPGTKLAEGKQGGRAGRKRG